MVKKKTSSRKKPEMVRMMTPNGDVILVPPKKVKVKESWGWKILKKEGRQGS